MIVVNNTSSIINLAAIDKFELIQQLYNKIFIPEAVNIEIRKCGGKNFPLVDLYNLKCI